MIIAERRRGLLAKTKLIRNFPILKITAREAM